MIPTELPTLPRSLRRFLFRSTGAARGTRCCGAGRRKTTSSTTGAFQGLILSVVPSGYVKIAIEAIEIVDLPIENGDFPCLPEGKHGKIW